jgi:ABC-type uncharacterized transport system involved in gliding motility auxiliary subunit
MLKRIFGLLGWLGVALVMVALAMWIFEGRVITNLERWQPWRFRLALAGLACTLLYILSQWREIARSFSGRNARFGTLAAASVAVVLAILVAINYIAERRHKRWDLTESKQFSLSDQTRKILGGLQKPVQVKVFSRSEDFERFRDRLDQYTYASNQVKVEYVDVERKPAIANQYETQSIGTVVVEYDGRVERVTSDSEQEITNAIVKATSGKQHKVYFVEGHGERSPDGGENTGYSQIASGLSSENFTHEKLVLAQNRDVPDDASVLVVAGPKTDFFPAEIEMLKRYLAKGGKLFLMIDPPEKADAPPLTNLLALAKEWAIEVDNNIVVDVSGMGQLLGTGAEVPVAARYESHAITQNFKLITAYRLARSINPVSGGVNGRFAQALVQTGPNSWAETDVKRLMTSGEVSRDVEAGDKAGPVTLAAAVSAPVTDAPDAPKDENAEAPPRPETRVVVFGDSDFAANGWLGIPGNRDLFMNSINWLAQQENLISIRPRDPKDTRMTLTADQQRRIFWVTVIVIPGLILLGGVQTWWRRR